MPTEESAKTIVVEDVLLLSPESGFVQGRVVARDGLIIAAGAEAEIPPGAEVVAGHGKRLTPGLVDLHVHGLERFHFDSGPDQLLAAAPRWARFGTATALPTLVPRADEETLTRVATVAGVLDQAEGVHLPGLHLEGPFFTITGAGCAVVPGDLGLLEDLLAAGGGRVRAMSLSPDASNILPVIERLVERGVVPFVTHTGASLAQTQAAIAAGARHATHFYDVFPAPPEHDPGVRTAAAVEAFLVDPRATVDFIADGCHVDPVVIQLAVRAKGSANVAIITDASVGAGLPPGEYDTTHGFRVRVEPGRGARVANPEHEFVGCLAGSALTMDVGMGNVLRWLDLPVEEIWALGTANPARIAGLEGVGTLAVGNRADMVLWGEDMGVEKVWVGGAEVGSGGPDVGAEL